MDGYSARFFEVIYISLSLIPTIYVCSISLYCCMCTIDSQTRLLAIPSHFEIDPRRFPAPLAAAAFDFLPDFSFGSFFLR